MEQSAKNYPKFISRDDIKKKFLEIPKLIIAGHELNFDLDEPDEFNDEFYIQKAKEELRETPEIVAQSLKELRELIAEEPDLHVPDIEEFYQTYLRPCKWYARSAFSLMKRHYRFIQNHPHIFTNLVPSKDRMPFCSTLIYPVPIRNKNGCRILIIEVGKRWKPKEISLDQLFRSIILCMFAALSEPKTQIAGAHVIIDMEGLSLSQVTYFTPSYAKMVTEFVQKCLPARLKYIHIVNQSFLFNMVFAFFKPFLEEKIRNRICFHGTNRESLMAFIDKNVLFEKYGGELRLNDEQFGVQVWQIFLAFEDKFKAVEAYGYKTEKNKK